MSVTAAQLTAKLKEKLEATDVVGLNATVQQLSNG